MPFDFAVRLQLAQMSTALPVLTFTPGEHEVRSLAFRRQRSQGSPSNLRLILGISYTPCS